ncbi:MAG: universal stress protein [Actinomycetota bacterium]
MSPKVIVVGVDGSETSLAALREAASYAKLMSASLRCVTTWNFPAFEEAVGAYDPEQDAKEIGREATRAVFGEVVPPWVTVVAKLGPAGPALVDESENASLLVVGTRGHGAVGRLLLGSVSTHCAERSKCPVLVVPGNASDASSVSDPLPAAARA